MPTFECPTCRIVHAADVKEEAPFRPFCSERCKMTDLGKWFDGTYTISEPIKPDDSDESDQSDDVDR